MSIQSQINRLTTQQKVNAYYGRQLIPLYWELFCDGKKSNFTEIQKHEMRMVEDAASVKTVRHFYNAVVKREGEHYKYPSNLTEENRDQAKYALKYARKKMRDIEEELARQRAELARQRAELNRQIADSSSESDSSDSESDPDIPINPVLKGKGVKRGSNDWSFSWKENGTVKFKCFSISKLGNFEAWRKAMRASRLYYAAPK